MLRVTVELLPGGREASRRAIASACITRVTGGMSPDYRVVLNEEFVEAAHEGEVRSYPRWAAESIWDFVVRCVLGGLTKREELPPRPSALAIPLLEDGRVRYVRLDDIPPRARAAFRASLYGSTVPFIAAAEGETAYAWDWLDFLHGRRAPRAP